MRSSAVTPARNLRRPAAAIIAALSVDSASGGTNTGMPTFAAARFGVGAQPAVGRHAAGDADAPRARASRAASNVRSSSASTTTRWKLAQMSAISWSGKRVDRPAVFSRTRRSTAVFRPLKLKSIGADRRRQQAWRRGCGRRVAIGVRHAAASATRYARSLPVARQPVDDRPAGIAEAEQLRHLVVRLARRIVARAAEQLVAAGLATRYRLVWPPDTTSTTAGSGSSPCCEHERFDVAGEVMDRHERHAARPGDATSRTTRRRAASRRARAPASPRPRRDPCQPTCACSSARSTTPQMSRTCWRDASSGTTPPHSRWMSACDATTFERSAHGRAGVAGLLDDGGGRLVAGGFDRRAGASVFYATTPAQASRERLAVRRTEDAALGDDAGDVAVRRHVERRVADLRALGRQPRRPDVASPRAGRAPRSECGRRPASPDRSSRAAPPRRTESCARAPARRRCRCRSCWRCRRWRRCDRRRRRRGRSRRRASADRPCSR